MSGGYHGLQILKHNTLKKSTNDEKILEAQYFVGLFLAFDTKTSYYYSFRMLRASWAPILKNNTLKSSDPPTLGHNKLSLSLLI